MSLEHEVREKILQRKGMTLDEYLEWEREQDKLIDLYQKTPPDPNLDTPKFTDPIKVTLVNDDSLQDD